MLAGRVGGAPARRLLANQLPAAFLPRSAGPGRREGLYQYPTEEHLATLAQVGETGGQA
jgi:hypothetical protein